MPAHCLNRHIAILTGRTHSTEYQQLVSTPLSINRSIIQGSGTSPTSYIILESDLKSKSIFNVLLKYADDTILLVPQHTDISLNDEFDAIKLGAIDNKIINIAKTKELVFHRPNPRLQFDDLTYLRCIKQVKEAKLHGVIFQDNLRLHLHVNSFLKQQCSQRSFLLKQLRCQGLSSKHLNTVFEAIIISCLSYALPAWGGFYPRSLKDALMLSYVVCFHLGIVHSCILFGIYLQKVMKLCFINPHYLRIV